MLAQTNVGFQLGKLRGLNGRSGFDHRWHDLMLDRKLDQIGNGVHIERLHDAVSVKLDGS